MLDETKKTDLFYDYYSKWIMVYKKGAIRKVTIPTTMKRKNGWKN